MKKIYFLDLHGTVYNSKNKISLKTLKTLKKVIKNGNKVIFITGAHKLEVEKLAKKINSNEFISNGGAYIKINNKEYIHPLKIDKSYKYEINSYLNGITRSNYKLLDNFYN
ncbi:MAG: HAD hydrolase family protein, partial [Mollicutes bacterium PWAP]|nr:HAD hydrolase family protein [Mollicutes bacterium PWAP]